MRHDRKTSVYEAWIWRTKVRMLLRRLSARSVNAHPGVAERFQLRSNK